MKELKQYYRQTSSWIPCGGRLKKEIMARLQSAVEVYLHENPTADFDALQVHFGTPQQIVTALVDEMGTEELLTKLHARNRIIKIVIICAAILIAICGLFFLSVWIAGLLDIFGTTVIGPAEVVG